jgi:hypothetical protein
MQSIPNDGDPLISVFSLDNAGYYLWLSPLLGAIFAVILTLMFVAGVLKGSLFPEFARSAGGAEGLPFFHFTWNTLPTSSEEYGKLFVWTFIAGFAERLVPDSLDSLASKLDPRQQTPSPPSGGPAVRTTPPEESDPPPKQESKSEVTADTLQDVLHSGESKKEPEKET